MRHPKDKPGLTRTQLLKRAAVGAAGVGGAALLIGGLILATRRKAKA